MASDLIATVVADQLASQYEMLRSLPEGVHALRTFVREYLSVEHRDQPGDGCPSAALLDEIVRCGDDVRSAYTLGLQRLVDLIASTLHPADPAAARDRAVALFTSMISTLQLARAVNDPITSDQILASGRTHAFNLIASVDPAETYRRRAGMAPAAATSFSVAKPHEPRTRPQRQRCCQPARGHASLVVWNVPRRR